MNRTTFALAAACALAGGAPAAAQYPTGANLGGYPGYGARPGGSVSPYLNLLQRGNPAVNYYNFVRPALQPPMGVLPPTNQLPLAMADPIVLDEQDPSSITPRPTGHPSGFMNTGGFFNSMGTIGQNRAPTQMRANQGRPAHGAMRR